MAEAGTPIADEIWAGVIVHDEWRIVDRWWTEIPFHRSYRDVTLNGRRRVQYQDDSTIWEWVDYPEHG